MGIVNVKSGIEVMAGAPGMREGEAMQEEATGGFKYKTILLFV